MTHPTARLTRHIKGLRHDTARLTSGAALLTLTLVGCTPTAPPDAAAATRTPAVVATASVASGADSDATPSDRAPSDGGAASSDSGVVARSAPTGMPTPAAAPAVPSAPALAFPYIEQARPTAPIVPPSAGVITPPDHRAPAPAATSPATTSDGPAAVPAGCAGLAVRDGERLAIDGQPFAFFGVNAHYLVDPEFPEARVGPVLQALAARGVNTVRVWFFHNEDPERFGRMLDLGRQFGIRFVVVLEDNVFDGVDWFFGDEDEEDYRPHLERTVARFRNRPEILMWEVINEPNCGDGRHDEECLDTIKDWLTMATGMVRALDPCRPVSTGMIGDGNYEEEERNFRLIHRKDAIDIVSVHRRTTDERETELEFADDENLPLYYGEIYDRAYDEGCQPLDGGVLQARAERIKDDLRAALDDGIDGYLLWDYAVGTLEKVGGGTKHYCSEFGYERTDPLWAKLADDPDLPPPVPWRAR